MRKIFCVLTLLAVVMAGRVSAQNLGVEVITADDIADIGDLTEIAFDFKIHPLTANERIDDIGGIKSWDGGKVMLARNGFSDKIMRFDNYKLTGVVDGMRKGEYYMIEDFSYDKANNNIYIENDSNLVTYDATTFRYKGKQSVNMMIQNVLNLGDKMLYFGYLTDEYYAPRYQNDKVRMPKESMILVDRDERNLKKGVILYRESSFERQNLGYPELFYVNPKNRSTCLPGNVNRIVTFDDKKVTEVYKFQLARDFVPQKYLDVFAKEEADIEEMENALRMVSMLGGSPTISLTYNIMVDNGTVSFRTAYNNRGGEFGALSRYLYWVHDKKGTKVYRHLRIPGLNIDIDPTGANGNHQIAVIENMGSGLIDKSVPMSPLARQIMDEINNQSNGNPVILEFRFK